MPIDSNGNGNENYNSQNSPFNQGKIIENYLKIDKLIEKMYEFMVKQDDLIKAIEESTNSINASITAMNASVIAMNTSIKNQEILMDKILILLQKNLKDKNLA